ncbi:MAG: metallophosphoesterase [Desulfobacterales bacterium]
MKFIHISDLHFHRSKKDNTAAVKLLKFIAQRYPAHNLIVTGDITDDGHAEQYDRAFEALAGFAGRMLICPGNHDFGAAGFMYERQRARLFDERLAGPLGQNGAFAGSTLPVVNLFKDADDQVLLIALESNIETQSLFDFACGEIGKSQLRALDAILGNPGNAGLTRFLFFHHHPFMRNDPFMELKDAPKLWPVVYGRLDVMLFGHRHVSEMWEGKGGVRFVLAADNAPGKDYAREVAVSKGGITVRDIPIA